MKQLAFVLALCLAGAAGAQQANSTHNISGMTDFLYDNMGRKVYVHLPTEVQGGSPFLEETYCYANLKVRNGKQYTNIQARINLETQELLYRDSVGTELVATVPIEWIELYDCKRSSLNHTVVVTGMPAIDKQDGSSFYVQLDTGEVSLLKYIEVTHVDKQNNFNGAAIVRTYHQNDVYYAYVPKRGMMRLAKDDAAVLEVLIDQQQRVRAFIAEHKLKMRKEEDLVKVFSFYNSLKRALSYSSLASRLP